MSMFMDCKKEKLVQIKYKTRIDVSDTFSIGDDIAGITIKPSATDDVVSVFDASKDTWKILRGFK